MGTILYYYTVNTYVCVKYRYKCILKYKDNIMFFWKHQSSFEINSTILSAVNTELIIKTKNTRYRNIA